ncbi:MAG: Omp28-related outer membrane protein [Ignavibacteriaceae bacterium]|nr:Omp28-related outer membrane protein [Ignavibacteriaceae bacterium]
MKSNIKYIWILLLIASQILNAQTQKMVLIEEFTNANCNSCPSNDANINKFVGSNWGNVISLQYHTWWPIADPFYSINPNENNSRVNYYGISTIQNYAVDGLVKGAATNPYLLTTQTLDRFFLQSPIKININSSITGNNVDVIVELLGLTSNIPSNLKLRVALIERKRIYQTAPGTNNVKEFNNIFRKFLTDTTGTNLGDFSLNDVKLFNLSQQIISSWESNELAAVAWIQDDETKEVIQSAISTPTINLKTSEKLAEFLSKNQSVTKTYSLTNYNSSPIQLRLMFDTLNLPTNWDLKLSTDLGVFDSVDITVNPNDVYNFNVNLVVDTSFGFTSFLVKAKYISDANTPSVSLPFFGVMKNSEDVLLVTDNKSIYDSVFLTTFNSFGLSVTHIKQQYLSLLFTYNRSSNFKSIFWLNSWDFPTFIKNDINFLIQFLDMGNKNLFIAGQDIGWDINSDAGTSNFYESRTFYSSYLNSRFVSDLSTNDTIIGVSGSPYSNITDKLNPVHFYSPDVIYPFDSDTSKGIIKYLNSDNYAGILNSLPNNSKTIYVSFGMEQVTENTRSAILRESANQFGIPVKIEEGSFTDIIPDNFELYQNYPNPFNPSTKISFMLPHNSRVKLEIFNSLGELVKTELEKELTRGFHSVEFSGNGLSSGIYIYRISVFSNFGNFSNAKKFILLK